MFNGKSVLAVIPARGGSKGVIKKNMQLVNGVPLVGYTIKSALASRYIDKVYVSSDDEETLSYASKLNAEIILRPHEFANDTASANSVVKHFFEHTKNITNNENSFIIYLQPTSPLRNEKHIDKAFEILISEKEEKLVSVVEVSSKMFKTFLIDKNNKISAIFGEKITNVRRQDLPRVYLPNGAIYIFKRDEFMSNDGFPSNGSVPYIMPEINSLDIDTVDDLKLLSEYIKET